eukprot:6916031-Lingulodinium_polyedra.AAC.1
MKVSTKSIPEWQNTMHERAVAKGNRIEHLKFNEQWEVQWKEWGFFGLLKDANGDIVGISHCSGVE